MPHSTRIIAAGELLVDLISQEYADNFREADTYRRFTGGSPANLAANLARLGKEVYLVASVGKDDAGTLLIDEISDAGVDTAAVSRVDRPTTLILVTKSREVSNFVPYRGADSQITNDQFDDVLAHPAAVFHTTAFALSREPARSSILDGARGAAEGGARLSIDANYALKIWPDRQEAMGVIGHYLRIGTGENCSGALAKFSDVDYHRLFGEKVTDPERATAHIRELGATAVCLTLGSEGCYFSGDGEAFTLPVRPVDVQDTTGAGDAFWSGFLAAYVEQRPWRDCALAGRAMAERKLATVGPLHERLAVETLLGD